jgi:two-component system, cell cycle sensor histidine kinase and response regulator CckA
MMEKDQKPGYGLDAAKEYEDLFNFAPDLLCVGDKSGCFLKVNLEWKRVLDYEPGELMGRTFFEFIHPEDLPGTLKIHDLARSGRHIAKWTNRFLARDGSFHWLEWRSYSRGDKIYAAARDITEQKRDQKSIEDSQRRLSQIIEFLPDATFVIDKEGRVVAWNKALEELTGVAAEDMIGRDQYAYSLAFYNERRPVLIDLVNSPDKITEEKYVFVKPQGNLLVSETSPDRLRLGDIHLSNIAGPLYDSDGRIEGAIESIRDITERKRMEDALRVSEEKYRLLVEHAGEAIFVAQDGMLKFTNSKTEDLIGYNKGELISKPFLDFIHPEDRHLVIERHYKRQTGAALPSRYTFRIIKSSGEARWVEITTVLIEWEKKPATLNFLSDVTERKKIEDALNESALFLKETQRIARLGGWKANPFTDYLEWNEGIYEIIEADKDYRPGLSEGLKHFLPEYIPLIREKLLECWSTGKSYALDCRLTTAKGKSLWAELRFIAPIKENDRTYVLGTLQDRTEQRSSEEEKEKLLSQFLQSQKMESVGRLAGGVAHDFNNMLGIIMGRTELGMLKVNPEMSIYQDLAEIQKAARQSADIVGQLLAFARRQTVSPKVLNLNETLEDSFKFLKRLIGENVELVWNPGEDIWPIKMDQSQINQIMVNLIVNSRDAIFGAGKIFIKTGNVTLDELFCSSHLGCRPGFYLGLSVSDTGAGMSREVLDHLFEPFYTTKEMGKGTGLGLSTVYGIIKQNRGFIYVSSGPGEGTTVDMYFPRFQGEVSSGAVPNQGEESIPGSELVLLIEDEEGILYVVETMLKRLGYRVLTAKSPNQAILLAAEHGPRIQLLITDVVMPEMNGRDLAERLKSINPDLKCLFMSGYTADVIAHWGVLNEGVHFIQKPFTLKDLSSEIRKALDYT